MNKKFLTFMAVLGTGVGSYIPVLLGDNDMLDGWSIIGGLVGGLLAIWLGVILSRKYGL